MIVQVITLHDLDRIIFIEIFEIKVVYNIYPRGCYQGITILEILLEIHFRKSFAVICYRKKRSNLKIRSRKVENFTLSSFILEQFKYKMK